MIQYINTHLHAFLIDGFRMSLWLTILCVIFVPLEHFFAIHKQKVWRKQFGNDLGYYVLSMVLPPMIMAPVLAFVAVAAHRTIPHGFYATVAEMPFWSRALAGFVVGDLGYDWAHRCLHAVPFLWRFHAIHHSAEQVDFLINTRMHPVDMVFGRLGGIIPLYILGLAGPIGPANSLVPVVVILIANAWGYFLHANLRWRCGPFDQVLATPVFHRWHHTVTPADRNFASMLPWLDRIFGTYHVPAGAWPERYGINTPMPASLVDQLVYPFVPTPVPPTVRPGLPTIGPAEGREARDTSRA